MTIRAAVIQAHANMRKDDAVRRHVELIAQAAAEGARVVCLQELFHGPYFPAEEDPKWFELAEPQDGPIVEEMRHVARRHELVLIVPFYERVRHGVYYNSAAVIEADGTLLGMYRKNHIPHFEPCWWEKFYFKPGNLGYPVFETSVGKLGILICYDRHYPEGARALGLQGAQIVFIPSATGGWSGHLWELEQRAHAVANTYFVGTVNRVGVESPLSDVRFYGSSYFCDPRGTVLAKAGDTADEVLVCDLDLDVIDEVAKHTQYYRDRRPDTYEILTSAVP